MAVFMMREELLASVAATYDFSMLNTYCTSYDIIKKSERGKIAC
jgi:phage terminase small subunit